VLEESDQATELEEPDWLRTPPAPPGALFLAKKIERRRFLRHGAAALFGGFMAVSTGTASVFGFLANPAQAAGGCCPACCGPSPCCNTSCCSKGCCAPVGKNYVCNNNGVTCFGFDNTWGGSHCWSCQNGNVITICCDCRINNRTNCPNPNGINRCICYQAQSGLSPTDLPKGMPVIRDARDVPSWAGEERRP
jgi:hypothetical protein